MNSSGDKGSWIVGGFTLVGVGVGLIFVQTAPLLMAASTLIGIGLGLAIAPLVGKRS